MFGKPEWFRERKSGRGLSPVSWQGWAYSASWLAVICLPFIILLTSRGVLSSLIWMGASIGLLVWDVRKVRLAKKSSDKEKDLFYIGADAQVTSLSTGKYDLRLRN